MKHRERIYRLLLLISGCIIGQSTFSQTATNDYEQFRLGGYGEMVGKFMDYGKNRFSGTSYGNSRENRNTISIPRFVLALDYKFNSKWQLGAEIEIESGGVGLEKELESSENGEYETEMEQGGEVAIEQFHITRLITPAFNLRAGHLIIPVGLTNAHHEPIHFFGTSRPEGETVIIPSTWHETGLEIFGSIGRGYGRFNYQAQIVAGLNPDGFGRDNWISNGKQGLFEEDSFSSPAYVGRIDYHGLKGVRIGLSAYYCHDVTRNADKPYKYATVGASSVTILSADAQLKNRYLTARGHIIYGNLQHAKGISNINVSNSGNSYHSGSMRQVAQNALSYGIEAGFNLKSLFSKKMMPTIYPFVRYDYYNPQEGGEATQTMDARCQVSKWTAGLNWYALPNLVVKADYTTRQIGTRKLFTSTKYNSENELAIGVAYVGWFTKK